MQNNDSTDFQDKPLFSIIILFLITINIELLWAMKNKRKQELISNKAKLAYPIRNGVPIMLPEEARKIQS